MWRYHWGWWLRNASGRKRRSSFEKTGKHFSFQYSLLLSGGALVSHPVVFFCFFFSLSTSLCRKSITEPRHSGHFQPECLRLLKRPLRGAFGTFPGLGSRPLSLFCSLCRPCSCYADRLARSAFHLLFASSCCKLTADVHTWPALGHSMAQIDRWSTGKGTVLTTCQSTI